MWTVTTSSSLILALALINILRMILIRISPPPSSINRFLNMNNITNYLFAFTTFLTGLFFLRWINKLASNFFFLYWENELMHFADQDNLLIETNLDEIATHSKQPGTSWSCRRVPPVQARKSLPSTTTTSSQVGTTTFNEICCFDSNPLIACHLIPALEFLYQQSFQSTIFITF
jgi:hypothetical protein